LAKYVENRIPKINTLEEIVGMFILTENDSDLDPYNLLPSIARFPEGDPVIL